jgi:RsiW-degrading membrane proteinase PrsW (M82 family)
LQEQLNPQKTSSEHAWFRVLLTGILLYFLGVLILMVTGSSNLFPTVVLLGSFLVPVAYVAFFYGRRHLSKLTMPVTALAFFYGGVLGVMAASILEPVFVRQVNFSTFFTIGVIEEFAKILGVLIIARRWRHDSEMDGLILGAAAGMGFAALESTGYAFSAFLHSGGSLSVTVGVTLLRGLLSPIGHGTWTAILASVLFRESKDNQFHLNRKVIGAFLLVTALHWLWDGLPGLLSAVFVSGIDVFIGEALVGGLSLFILWLRWREANRLQIERMEEEQQSNVDQIDDGSFNQYQDESPLSDLN